MIQIEEALKELLEAVEDAIQAGDWTVDGACDPDLVIKRSKKALAQRTWVGLTDDDWKQITRKANYHWEMTTSEYAERIGELTEAKLKELNT